MLRSFRPSNTSPVPNADRAPSARRAMRSTVTIAVLACALLLSVAPPVLAAPPSDSPTVSNPQPVAWEVPLLERLRQAVGSLFVVSGSEADDGPILDPFGIDQPPADPTTETSPDATPSPDPAGPEDGG